MQMIAADSAGGWCRYKTRLDLSRQRKSTPPLPTEHAALMVIDQTTKAIAAILNGLAITSIKTAVDSVRDCSGFPLAAERAAR